MYLKQLELIGFKSFAEKTALNFERGMTAIVGPNGCGKSNVSDAIRWVIGEQSAKALRGGKMQDVIFDGTDDQKPHGMAEVSLMLAECEGLGTEYNEVTVTRRVFRSGEGEYFINKAPCRLKDIQRLFMGTGIGTSSYSVMEQGRIDLILSSRPEDRREVFEEASGITKFKADKKEALRKLENTEANLLRLADIIAEVKRQIISLQRQAGKARRYKELRDSLRGIDLFLAREILQEMDQQVGALENRIAALNEQDESERAELGRLEQSAAAARALALELETEIGGLIQALNLAAGERDRLRQTIDVNRERSAESAELQAREQRDLEESEQRLSEQQTSLAEQQAAVAQAEEILKSAEQQLNERLARLRDIEEAVERTRQETAQLRTETLDIENRNAHLQNELHALDAQERQSVIRHERLAAEKTDLLRTAEIFSEKETALQSRREALRGMLDQRLAGSSELQARRQQAGQRIHETRRQLQELEKQFAGRRAQLDVLQQRAAQSEGFPAGARRLMDPAAGLPVDRAAILGPLAEQVQADPDYQRALEAVLRAWLDAVVVADRRSAVQILRWLEADSGGAIRLLAPGTAPATPAGLPGEPLLAHVKISDSIRPAVEHLLGPVRVVPAVESLPAELPAAAVFVTLEGVIVRGDGSAERWARDGKETNPLARHHLQIQAEQELTSLEEQLRACQAGLEQQSAEETRLAQETERARVELDQAKRELAMCEGESQVVTAEARQARERVETVEFELHALADQQSAGVRRGEIGQLLGELHTRKTAIQARMNTLTEAQQDLDSRRGQAHTEVGDSRVRVSEKRQQVEHAHSQIHSLGGLIRESEQRIAARRQGIAAARERGESLRQATVEAETRIPALEETCNEHQQRLAEARRRLAEQQDAEQEWQGRQSAARGRLDELRARKSQSDVELAELRIRRQNLEDRVTGEYRVTAEDMRNEPVPAWEDGVQPDRDTLETRAEEIRAKLESMGAVNLTAIEELKELEDRFAFLTSQQADLVNAKQQLMEMIRKINKTTTEMFQTTFEQVNQHFQDLFRKLFGGGSAKLVLADEQDVLESGIEIIARPPGKKLQSVSLLSGGERTMTAVALLFALYEVKPSPFCLLDELDAALDESNIGRFVETVKGYIAKSQWIIITHNRATIAAADMIYGVTMQRRGISKIISVKFSDHELPLTPGPQPVSAPAG